MNQSAHVANALARQIGARRYLEIGVSAGATFRDIEIVERTGVDPNFLFDINGLTNECTRLVASTSDEFFATEPLSPLYDIVFIDGLHTFEQVVRDFSNALVRTHRHSVLILDDTLPNDVYSAIPDPVATQRYRKKANVDSGQWHGDVFKIVFYIHDFWPSLNYRTITGTGNPLTIVWRANKHSRQPLLNNLEKISRLTYFDLQEHLEVLRTATSDEAIAQCVAELEAI